MSVPRDRRRPNLELRSARRALSMSQVEFAAAVVAAGRLLGQPNHCTKRLVQKWESGEHVDCRPHYRRALQKVAGKSSNQLGFPDRDDESSRIQEPTTPGRPSTSFLEAPDRFRFALAAPLRADGHSVRLFEVSVDHLFDRAQHQPASEVLAAVVEQLNEAASLLIGVQQGSVRRRLAAAGGRCAALGGRLITGSDDELGARRFLGSAAAAARVCGDVPLLGCVFTHLSDEAMARGSHGEALSLACRALEYVDDDRATRAWTTL